MSVSIAVFGLHGSLGQPTIDAINSGKFDNKLKFPVKAITRKDKTSTDRIEYIKTEINPDTVDSIAAKLPGVDVIIELLACTPDLFACTEQIVAKVKPKLFIPSQFGSDYTVCNEFVPGMFYNKISHSENVRKMGVKAVDIITTFFAQPGLYMYEVVGHLGIDPKTKSYFQIGDLNTKVPFTRVEDIGYVVLAVSTTPIDTLPDEIKVKSGSISYADAIDKYEQTHDVKLEKSSEITTDEARKQLNEKLKQTGGFNWNDFLWYLHVIGAHGIDYDEKDNELINPNQSVWEWTKY
ncbi:CIP1 protein [Spathaspora passalidarum NRRL Y-27907]|uniref:CIP1 protein n=1 Tax=Spathaspora passalidarum (strain NRRL Y-27907 / 11-Y1) TaxID=619300 RepID=G3AV89_SPAPN|nr:CIP1 protein [Spathaspora passalidarum NRRL Y-27907]EGW29892.1 CIP1 protein [Spathaspora passalidarum NRRL Y-27907]